MLVSGEMAEQLSLLFALPEDLNGSQQPSPGAHNFLELQLKDLCGNVHIGSI